MTLSQFKETKLAFSWKDLYERWFGYSLQSRVSHKFSSAALTLHHTAHV
jgi:hypothetical protein